MTALSKRQALRTAALAHACGLPWGACPGSVPTSFSRCTMPRGHGGRHFDRSHNDWEDGTEWAPRVEPIPETIEAWREQWAERCAALGVDPGEGPATSWKSEDGRIRWAVSIGYLFIYVGSAWASVNLFGFLDLGVSDIATPADLADLSRLVTAATAGT